MMATGLNGNAISGGGKPDGTRARQGALRNGHRLCRFGKEAEDLGRGKPEGPTPMGRHVGPENQIKVELADLGFAVPDDSLKAGKEQVARLEADKAMPSR